MYLGLSLLLVLVCVILWRIIHKAKLKIDQRFLHSRSVSVTLIFSVAVVVFFAQILLLVNSILRISFIREIVFYVFPSENASAAFFWIVTLLLGVLISLFFLVLIWLCYWLWLKPIAGTPILRTRNPLEKLFNRISASFYHLQEAPAEIMPRAHAIGHWIRYIRNIFGVLLLGEGVAVSAYLNFNMLTLNDESATSIIKSLFMLPLLTFFLLDQIVIFLQAERKDGNVLINTERLGLTHTGDYNKFVNLYERCFGGKALISYYINNSPLSNGSLFSGPDSELLARASNPRLLSAVCRSVNNATRPLRSNYIEALVDLINGNSMIMFDSFRGEFVLYYLSYLQQNLFLRRKALVIASSDDQVQQIIEQYKEVFLRINKTHPIWKIESVRSMPIHDANNVDILVCTLKQLFDSDLLKENVAFFRDLHDVTILDIYSLLCREKLNLLRLFRSINQKNVQFMFFSEENNDDIKKSVAEVLDTKNISLYSNLNNNSQVCIMCWREESYYKTQHVISKNLKNDFGIGYTLALIACKFDVSRIHIHGHSDVPLKTYAGTVKASAALINEEFFKTDRINVESVIRHNPIIAYHDENLSFDIYYDNPKNLLNTIRLAMSNTASVTSMIHIISKPYMLRDYFAHTIQNLSGTQMRVPSLKDNLKPHCIVLLIMLREKGMTLESVVAYMNNLGVKEKNVEKLLSLALESSFGKDNSYDVYQSFSFADMGIPKFENNQYHYTYTITLTNEKIYHEAIALANDYVQITGATIGALPISKSAVYNYCLPGQMLCYDGRRYLIDSINNGVVQVNLEETVEKEEDYTHCYEFAAHETRAPSVTVQKDEYTICKLYQLPIQRTTTGFLAHYNGLDFNKENNNTTARVLETPIEETKTVSVLELSIQSPFGETYERSATLFCVLFRGLLETVLPNNYRDIMVTSAISRAALEELPFEPETPAGMREDPIPSDWLENLNYELPLSRMILKLFPNLEGDFFLPNSPDAIHLYFINFNDDDSAVRSVMADMDRLLSILRAYMDWVVQNPRIPHAYLKLGYHLFPPLFDTQNVQACLQRIAQDSTTSDGSLSGELTVSDMESSICCDFCGRPIPVSMEVFDDSRIMCEDCAKHRVSERDEVNKLLDQAYQTMEDLYQITIPRNIKVRFAAATSIKNKYPSDNNPGSRVLGLYLPSEKAIWIERGGPEACVLSTLIHELTHAWQDANVNMNKLSNKIIEGHSTFVEIQCLRRIGQTIYAEYWEKSVLSRTDDYAEGLRYWQSLIDPDDPDPEKNIFHQMLKL